MDKIAIISDIHGNMTALDAVLADIRQRGIDLIYNLGDLVGKGPQSHLAIDRCREVCQVIVRGNWDDGLLQPDATDHPVGSWFQAQIGPERLAYLNTLPGSYDFWLSGQRVRLFHASQEGIYTRVYPWSPFETLQAMFTNSDFTGFDGREPTIVGYGDIHDAYMLSFLHKTLFNAGSVGNPLDMPMATYAILTGVLDSQTPDAFSAEFVRVAYDIEAEVEIARTINMPQLEAYIAELRTAVYRGRQQGNGSAYSA